MSVAPAPELVVETPVEKESAAPKDDPPKKEEPKAESPKKEEPKKKEPEGEFIYFISCCCRIHYLHLASSIYVLAEAKVEEKPKPAPKAPPKPAPKPEPVLSLEEEAIMMVSRSICFF